MALEEVLDNYEQRFRKHLQAVEEELDEGDFDERSKQIIETQNDLLDLLYDAVIYAHESDYTSHLSSEIKKTDKIIADFEALQNGDEN
ncbi:MAG: hypothetical protein ABEK50_15315 [bacterium]